MNDLPKTIICYYQGADGPTIRIDARAKEWLGYFKKCICLLIKGDALEISINYLDHVKLDNIETFKLVKVSCRKYSNIIVSNNCVIWSRDVEALITIAGLVDGLIDGEGPGHQYLDGMDDKVSIVLAINEID